MQDVVGAIIGLMNCEQSAGKVFNIGSAEEISIEVLADKVIEITGSRSKKKFVPYDVAYGRPIEDMMRRVPSLAQIKKMIGWEPKSSLEETLQVVINTEKAKTVCD